MVSPDGVVHVWFIEPIGMATYITGHLTEAAAYFMAFDASDRMVELRGEDTLGFYFIHDWRNFRTYDPPCRKLLTDWGVRLGRKNHRDTVILLSEQTPRLARMACQVGATVMNSVGLPIRVAPVGTSFEDVSGGVQLHPGFAQRIEPPAPVHHRPM